jgi:predicted nucleic acid-binding Zn ribbon protein
VPDLGDGAGPDGGEPTEDGPTLPDDRPVSEIIELKAPGDVAREALNRARAAAKAKGLYPGAQRRRILAEPRRSGPGKDGRDPKLFAETLSAFLEQRGWVQEVSVGGVIGRWREVVGDDIADHCEPETFDNGILTVRASSTAWATQIRLLVPQLLGVLEREVGQDVVQTITVQGPAGPGFGKGFRSVQGRGARDTYG